MKNPNNKRKKNSISNLIKSLIKIYTKYCQQLDFEAFPENLNNKNKDKTCEMGPE